MPLGYFGYPQAWEAFHQRHALYRSRFPNLLAAFEAAFIRTLKARSPADQVIFHLSRLCGEDFNEILLLCGNAYGLAAQKLLRGLYERAVTARYISMHPEKAIEFIEFGKINMYKLIAPIRETGISGVLEPAVVDELTAFHKQFKKRGRTPKGLADRFRRFLRSLRGGRERARSTSRWTDDLSFESMARQVKSLRRMVVLCWHVPTMLLHASAQNISTRVRETAEGAIEFDGELQPAQADDALNWATLVVLDVLDLQRSYFDLKALEPLIQKCRDDYIRTWHKPGTAEQQDQGEV